MKHGSIFTIKGFVADANICGVPREVEFRDGTLHIRGLDIGEARQLLRGLAPQDGGTRYVDTPPTEPTSVGGFMREAITQDIDREVLGDPPNLAPKAKPSKPAKATAAPSPPKSSPKQPQADTAPTSATTQAASQEEVAMEEGEADARAKTPELADTPPPDATKAAAPAKSETRAERRARLRKEREAAEAKAPAPAEPGTEEDLESEDLAADVAAEGCKACGGTKKNSRGGPCRACQVREVPRSAGDEGPADGEDAEEPAVEGPDETPLVEHGADALDPQLVGASRLKHVLDFLMQNEGLEGEKELIERCKELQEKVPALERVGTNLDVRVKRTLAYVMKNK